MATQSLTTQSVTAQLEQVQLTTIQSTTAQFTAVQSKPLSEPIAGSFSRSKVLDQLRYELNDVLNFIHHASANQLVKEHENLAEDLNLDSLDVMDFIARAELFFKLEIGDHNIEKLYNLGLIADFICGDRTCVQ